MEMCPTCRGAVAPGQPACGVCGTVLAADRTAVQPLPQPPPGYGPPPAAAPPHPSPYPTAHGTPPAAYPTAYGSPPACYPTAYGPPPVAYPVYAVPVAPVYVPVVAPPRSRIAAALLCLFLGGLGIHRFYTGQTGLGVALLLTSLILGPLTLGLWYGVTIVWVLVDLVLILCGAVSDQYGRPLEW